MACSAHCALLILAGIASQAWADEIAWGDVSADGVLDNRALDVPVAMARGADNFFIANPMDSHDWTHTSVVRNSLKAQLRAQGASKIAELQEALRPIFKAMPKDVEGRVNNATARYVLHRLFSQKHSWSIKGLQPAGASWMATMSVTPDVKDITKYMMPTYLQQLLSAHLGVAGYDLRSLAVLAAAMEHLIHAEMTSIVYSVFTTLGLPIPGKRTEKEVDEVLDTFVMVFAFGVNLDVSTLEDVQKAKAHLDRSHSGWPQLQALAADVKNSIFTGEKMGEGDVLRELDFAEIVQVAEKIGEGYAKWQGKDCVRVKEELVSHPSHHAGRVQLSEVQPSHSFGGRSLFTETVEDLKKLGVLSETDGKEPTVQLNRNRSRAQLTIANYVNSQSMCLSTASFYTACCTNQCEGHLAMLERLVAAPSAGPAQLARLVSALPGSGLSEPLLQELPGLVDQSSGLVALHGRAFAGWMHRAFPLECPAPHSQKVTNPMTPDEWMGESVRVQELEGMMAEIAHVLARYTTMGNETGHAAAAFEESIHDASADVVSIKQPALQQRKHTHPHVLATTFRFMAMASMMVLVAIAAKSGLLATGRGAGKLPKAWARDVV